MIEREERAALMKSFATVVKEYLSNALKSISTRIEALETGFRELPGPERGEKGEKGESGVTVVGPPGPPGRDAVVDIPAIVAEVVKQVPIPQNGKDGRDGERGPQGIPGPAGESIKGEKGEPGLDGKNGIDGKDGKDGRGGQSIEGPQGPPGPAGKDGINGKDGESIEGPQGLQGIRGERGECGSKGDKGEPGIPGRDALQLDMLSAVDLSKSYPRGTYARFDGGIIRSFRDTIPGDSLEKSGWEAILSGIASIGISLGDDSRTLCISTRTTGGEIQATSFVLPVMIYRDIYKSDSKYQRGDVVTWGGSTWHCQIDAPKAAPGDSTEWRLMVKEGRRGKDGKDGERGPRGEKGDPGKDLTQMTFTGEKY